MRVQLEPAFVLHRRPYRDSSLLLEVFSREHGRQGLVARGARRPKGRWRGLLEPLQRLRLSWSGRGELGTLTAAEPEARRAIAGDGLYAGYYAGELILRLTARADPHPELFDILDSLLAMLADGADPGPPLRLFERDLLAEIGYGVPLTHETDSGEPVRPDAAYVYHPAHGLRRGARAAPGEIPIAGDALHALAAGDLSDTGHARAARRLLAAGLAAQLGPQPLRTMQTLRALRRFRHSEES
ncbi:DNA repair protein RecO [Salinisphaera sp. PC39]|uniref:DNA repair protein RecO n=1 Tax=Salinisphaera sp. PC39 TaxID=1304156 RepID=UPI00333E8B5B